MEVWGGAVPDSVMRYLDESPWERLRIASKAMKGKSLLSALSPRPQPVWLCTLPRRSAPRLL